MIDVFCGREMGAGDCVPWPIFALGLVFGAELFH